VLAEFGRRTNLDHSLACSKGPNVPRVWLNQGVVAHLTRHSSGPWNDVLNALFLLSRGGEIILRQHVGEAGGKSELATKLETVSDQALDKLAEIMSLPLVNGDPAFASVLRSQTTAAGVALNTQVRVDEVALRKQEHDRVPELLRLAAEVRARLPPWLELEEPRNK
jgi:hypothetical protein